MNLSRNDKSFEESYVGIEETKLLSEFEKNMNKLVFLKSDFNLFKMALLLKTPPSSVSKLIRNGYGFKFSEIIIYNKLNYLDCLIEEELNQNRKIKFVELYKKAGFKSRSNFYLSFKKVRNTSPNEYYRKLFIEVFELKNLFEVFDNLFLEDKSHLKNEFMDIQKHINKKTFIALQNYYKDVFNCQLEWDDLTNMKISLLKKIDMTILNGYRGYGKISEIKLKGILDSIDFV